jgi:DNA polymerase III delta prime subunit
MTWNEITGQDAAVRFLRRALGSCRLPSLLLFAGPRGVGKRTTAHVFAAAALCEAGEGTDEPCGRCGSCREAAAGVNADLVLPKYDDSPVGKPPDYRDLADEDRTIGLKRTVRLLLEDVRRRSVRGGRRVALIRRAERMNEESQNTILKSLEEPAGGLVWVLTADDPSRFLDTVRSRATKVRFGRVPTELLAGKLARGLGGGQPLTPERAREVARAAEGSFARAVEMLSESWLADREFVESSLLPVLTTGREQGPVLARELVARAKATARKGKGKGLEAPRRSALRLVGALARVLRDRLRDSLGVGGAGEPAIWADGLEVALESEAALRQNVRVELALTVAGLRLARAGRSAQT